MALASLSWLTLMCACALAADDAHHKRAPSGFTGVRGKKSIPDSAYEEEFVPDDIDVPKFQSIESPAADPSVGFAEKRAPLGFMGMRGKKLERFGGWPTPPPVSEDGGYGDVWLKRAPSGFFGMRGKKDYEDLLKRGPSGFFGMRGKKESLPWNYGNYMGAKRAPMGFVGMRGKKSSDVDEEKRAPSGFFGMRGKKPSGFFGMRGKKYPFEFRGKFVGVRGKKISNSVTAPGYDVDLDRLGEELDINQLMLLLTAQNESDFDNEWNNNINDGLSSQ